jgi:hypothetical protein
MRHVLLPGAPATGPYRMGQTPAAARLVAPTGGTLGVISGLLRTAAGTIDLTAVAAAANKHLRSTTDTHEQPGRRRHRRGLAHAWTTIAMLGIMPRHACSARCGARRRFGTWRFRSAPCLPIWQVVNAQLCARSTSSHLRRTPTCGYVDNASALPTDPQDQKTKASVNLIALKAQHSNQVRHNPDRQPGQPRHPSPHSVPILAAIHSGLCERLFPQEGRPPVFGIVHRRGSFDPASPRLRIRDGGQGTRCRPRSRFVLYNSE